MKRLNCVRRSKPLFGKGSFKVVEAVNGEIFDAISGRDATDQKALDRTLINLDGTPDKSRLGQTLFLGLA